MNNNITPHPRFAGYYITPCGKVYSDRSGQMREKKQTFKKQRYFCVSIECTGAKRHGAYEVHRLVAETFLHKPTGSCVVNHKNRDTTNNNVYNLEYITQGQNVNHWRQDDADGFIRETPPIHSNIWWC